MDSTVRIAPGVAELLPLVDTVIFDIDGVLLDVSHTIRRVNCLAIPDYLRRLPGWTAPDDLLVSEDIEHFKRAGGFNDDLELSRAAVLLYLFKAARYGLRDAAALHPLSPTIGEFTDAIHTRGGWLTGAQAFLRETASSEEWETLYSEYDAALIDRLFLEIRAGDLSERLYGFAPFYHPGPGTYPQDRVLIDLTLLPAGKTFAILTGRMRTEAEIALEQTGLTEILARPEQRMTSDDGNRKPEPDGLRRLLAALDSTVSLYIGDALDDMNTVLNYRLLPDSAQRTVLSAQVLTGTVGPDAPTLFAPADVIAPDVNAVLRLL